MKRRMLAGLVVVAVGASAITAGLLAGVGGAGQAQTGSDAVSRVEKTYNRPWSSSCDFDACGITILFQIPVTTPVDRASVDVTLTATLHYATSPGTAAIAGASIDDGTPPSRGMAPGGFRLAPARRLTTTSFTWVKRDLAAAGRPYTFQMSVVPRPLIGQNKFSVRGRKLSVVIETWSAGD